MGWSKRQILNDAFSEIGMAGYLFDLEPEDLQTALNRLDSFIAQWEADGIYTGYLVVDDPDMIDIDSESGIESGLVLPVIKNLAVEMAPAYGKTPAPKTTGDARKGYSIALRTKTVPAKAANVTVTPAGSGVQRNTQSDHRFLEPER